MRLFTGANRHSTVLGLFSLMAGILTGHSDPFISSFFPTFGNAGSPTFININGSGFSGPNLIIRFNGVLATNFGAPQDNLIQARVAPGTPLGPGPIFVSVAGVGHNSSENFTVIGTGPFVASFSPTNGAPGTTVTLSGANFSNPVTVNFGGVSTVTNTTVSSSVQVKVPTNANTGAIMVTTPAGSYTTSNSFYVPPDIVTITPTNGRAGTNVLITGKNFIGTTAVQFGGLNASFTVLSNTAIQATAPVGVTNALIRVIAPAGSDFSPTVFRVLPTISGFNPNFGSFGTAVTITGTNLNEGSGVNGAPQVFFNGVASLLVTNVSFNQLTAYVPNAITSGKISVTTTNGSATNDALFHVPAVISSITPNTNPPGSRVRIDGTNFLGTTAVIFPNNVPSPNFTVTNNNIIGAEVPNGITTGGIQIVTPAGTANSSTIYYAAPLISTFNPLSGLPGTNVTISGANFFGATAVRFSAPGGFVNGQMFPLSATTMNVTVPNGAMTGRISVVGPAGIGTSQFDFTLNYSSLQITVTNTPNPAQVGLPVTYSIQVKNLGPNAATVLATNILPASVTFSSSTAGTTVGGTTAVNLGSLNVNDTASFSVTGVPSVAGVFVTNATTASSGPMPTYPTTTRVHFVEPPALLRAEFYPPTSLLLSWPTLLSNYGLEFRTNLALGNWFPVPTPPVANNGTNTVSEQMTSPERFYRLKR